MIRIDAITPANATDAVPDNETQSKSLELSFIKGIVYIQKEIRNYDFSFISVVYRFIKI